MVTSRLIRRREGDVRRERQGLARDMNATKDQLKAAPELNTRVNGTPAEADRQGLHNPSPPFQLATNSSERGLRFHQALSRRAMRCSQWMARVLCRRKDLNFPVGPSRQRRRCAVGSGREPTG